MELFNGRDLTGWVNVNTEPETWSVKDGLLVCSGKPIGVMRSEKQYENFVLHIACVTWRPAATRGYLYGARDLCLPETTSPRGWKCRCWNSSGSTCIGPRTVSLSTSAIFPGNCLGHNGLTATPDNPRGNRSMSRELRCKGKGQWNFYDVVCVDGTVKLAINGKFINSISDSSVRKGYLCLESEGAEIHFRNIRILELPPGITTP